MLVKNFQSLYEVQVSKWMPTEHFWLRSLGLGTIYFYEIKIQNVSQLLPSFLVQCSSALLEVSGLNAGFEALLNPG